MSHTFRITSIDPHALSSSDIAELLFKSFNIQKGFICSHMEYRSAYKETYKFHSAPELQAAIDNYCDKHDTSSFEYNEFYIIFVLNGRLMKITIHINMFARQGTRLIETFRKQLQSGHPDQAEIYKTLFKTDEQIVSKKQGIATATLIT